MKKWKIIGVLGILSGMLISSYPHIYSTVYASETGWYQDAIGWRYVNQDGSYQRNRWFQDKGGKWYYFDENGYMKTGWFQDTDGKWYYLNQSGDMAFGTVIDGIYRLGTDGAWIEEYKKKQETQETNVRYTAEDIKNKNLSSYTEGTGSVYGPRLAQSELNEVSEAVANFMNRLSPDLDTVEKVLVAHNYLAANCSYAVTWAENGANTAWGALVYHEAQCSGYARAMKALCDAMDVNCYYVHSDEDAHQWNMVEIDGNWYIVDVQADATSSCFYFFLCGDDFYSKSYDKTIYPTCSEKSYDIMPYYEKLPESSSIYFYIAASIWR